MYNLGGNVVQIFLWTKTLTRVRLINYQRFANHVTCGRSLKLKYAPQINRLVILVLSH